MSLCRAALLASNLAIANVNALQQQTVRRADLSIDPNVPRNAMKTEEFVDWKLDNLPTVNNLGGEGPNEDDPEEMRLPKIHNVNGVDLDLVVRINEEKQDRPYEANNVGNNKVQEGFGITNIKSGGVGHLNFRFTKHGEDATWYPSNTHQLQFKFTIFDVDESKQVQEEVIFDTPIDHLYLADNHTFHETHGGNNTEGNPLYFVSSSHGTGGDNPRKGPNELNETQARRAITVAYKDKSEWNITFRASMRDPHASPRGGRNFMWAGASDVPDAQACIEWAEPTFPWAICDKNGDSNVVTNNLGGLGPHLDGFAPAEIRYATVATVHGHQLDLVVKADEGYEAWNVSRNTVINAHSDASIHGCFGAINVKHETKATLTFSFVYTGTDELAKLGEDGFGFTVYDLDHDKAHDNEEKVRFVTKPHSWIMAGNEVEKVKEEENAYRALDEGKGKDNVFSKDDARDWDQIRKSVRVMYQGLATWQVELSVQGGTEGRNFLFGGCLHLPEDVVMRDHAYQHVAGHDADQ